MIFWEGFDGRGEGRMSGFLGVKNQKSCEEGTLRVGDVNFWDTLFDFLQNRL